MKAAILATILLSLGAAQVEAHSSSASGPLVLDQRASLQASQAVIGATPGDYVMLDREGRPVRLSSYRGKPLLVNFIYTGCFHICPTSTAALHRAVRSMRDRFGANQFNIVSIGFNQPIDSPVALKAFAAQQRIDDANWEFLSPNADDVAALARDFGFSYAATPAGFDHILQVTMLDAQGVIRRQVYGDQFAAAALGEPLKALLTDGLLRSSVRLPDILDRVRILCSVYDPAIGKYRLDYTLAFEIAGGVTFVLAMLWFAAAEWRSRRARRRGAAHPRG